MRTAVVYACVKRKKRGFYRIDLELLCENPKDTREGEITEMHTRRLERDILENPSLWLWSHRRWKHSRPPVLNDERKTPFPAAREKQF